MQRIDAFQPIDARARLRLDRRRTRVVLLDAKERLLPGFSPVASAYAEQTLRARGVEVRLGLGVDAVSAAGVTLEQTPA